MQRHQHARQARIGQPTEQTLTAARMAHQMAQQPDEQNIASPVEQQRLAAAGLVHFGAHQVENLL